MPIASAVDVAILGSGPAAWATASACCQAGLSVTLIAPSPRSAWAQTYGVWLDQITSSVRRTLGLGDTDPVPISHQWPEIAAVTGSTTRALKRTYCLLDNVAIRAAFESTAHATGLLTVRTTLAKAVTHDQWSSVAVAKGKPIEARLVIDASGFQSPFVQRANGGSMHSEGLSEQSVGRDWSPVANVPPADMKALRDGTSGTPTGFAKAPFAMQAAYGVVAEVDRAPYEGSVLMDWTGPNRRDASFLYALDLGGHWLLEETSLARNPALAPEELKARLYSRLASMGVTITAVHSEEHVLFPMDLPLPTIGQRTLAIGAAGAIVHPATGYSVAASLRLAPRIAEGLRVAFAQPSADGQSLSDAGWRVIWPTDRRRARTLESYGLDRLLTMNQSEICGFFDTFFTLGPTVMTTYLGGEASSTELATVMWKVFQKAPLRLRSRLASGNPLALARTLLS
jgi:2-polyprenyl-6-methoxyphenol hydroxylase-like FAD-dependent oxidoreductase